MYETLRGKPNHSTHDYHVGLLLPLSAVHLFTLRSVPTVRTVPTMCPLQLLNICSEYGIKYDVQYNAKTSVVLIFRTKGDKELFVQILICQDKFSVQENKIPGRSSLHTMYLTMMIMMMYIYLYILYTYIYTYI